MENAKTYTYLRRKIDSFLIEWKSQVRHLPLIVKGARQIGKTESIRKFALENYESLVEINFAENQNFKTITREGYSAEKIVKNITLVSANQRFIPGRTLIFFDEIQEFPEIATSFKFFAQDGRYDVIASGSLLGIQYKRIASISVGYQDSFTMRSMDFEEYLWALGYRQEQIDDLVDTAISRKPFGDSASLVMDRHFMDYCILGGMPRIVSEFAVNGHFGGITRLQQQILDDYRSDIRKYCEGLDPARIQGVFDSIPSCLAAENKKFKYSQIEPGARRKDYYGCIEWLKDAGVANLCYRMSHAELPIRGNIDFECFKIYLCDSGLLCSLLDEKAQEDIRMRRNLGTWKGGFFENVVAEAIVKSGTDLVYYRKDSATAEIDFLLRTHDNLVPIEVKSENASSKSLNYLIKNSNYKDIQWGVKLVHGNLGFENSILTLPQWCAFLLPRIIDSFNIAH